MWGRNTRVVVFPSVLAIGFLGQSTGHLHSLPADFIKSPLALWGIYAASGSQLKISRMFFVVFVAGLAISIIVNAVMTVLIVFKILKIFWQVKTTSDGGTLWHILFVIIESGMLLLFIQVFRMVATVVDTDATVNAYPISFFMHDAFNVIIRSVHRCCCFY